MKTKYTPGPWVVDYINENPKDYPGLVGRPFSQTYILAPGADKCIAVTQDSDMDLDSGEANARLIAAAPELLEQCRDALERLELLTESFPENERYLGALRAVIAKATSGKTF